MNNPRRPLVQNTDFIDKSFISDNDYFRLYAVGLSTPNTNPVFVFNTMYPETEYGYSNHSKRTLSPKMGTYYFFSQTLFFWEGYCNCICPRVPSASKRKQGILMHFRQQYIYPFK